MEGSLTTSSWDDAETGKKRYKTEIKAQRVHFLDRKGEGTSPSPMDGGTPFEGDDTKFADDDIPF